MRERERERESESKIRSESGNGNQVCGFRGANLTTSPTSRFYDGQAKPSKVEMNDQAFIPSGTRTQTGTGTSTRTQTLWDCKV